MCSSDLPTQPKINKFKKKLLDKQNGRKIRSILRGKVKRNRYRNELDTQLAYQKFKTVVINTFKI